MWDTNSSLLREKLHILRYLSVVGHHTTHGVFGEATSLTCLDVALLSFAMKETIQLVLRFIFQKKLSHV